MKVGEKHIQFSKIMVFIVLAAVTLLAALGMIGMVVGGEYEQVPGLFTHYTDFASIVFVAYSGNSVAEKWIGSGKTKNNGAEESVG